MHQAIVWWHNYIEVIEQNYTGMELWFRSTYLFAISTDFCVTFLTAVAEAIVNTLCIYTLHISKNYVLYMQHLAAKPRIAS